MFGREQAGFRKKHGLYRNFCSNMTDLTVRGQEDKVFFDYHPL